MQDAWKMIDRLTPDEVLYATDPARKEPGFAALHDLFDANELLPGADRGEGGSMPGWLDRACDAIEAFNALLLAGKVVPA